MLVINGEDKVRHRCQAELAADGYDVATANDIGRALQLPNDAAVDLVVFSSAPVPESVLANLPSLMVFRRGLTGVANSGYPACLLDFRFWAAYAVLQRSSDLTELKGTVNRLLRCQPN